eukprot:69474-Rhodomonas_salina.4
MLVPGHYSTPHLGVAYRCCFEHSSLLQRIPVGVGRNTRYRQRELDEWLATNSIQNKYVRYPMFCERQPELGHLLAFALCEKHVILALRHLSAAMSRLVRSHTAVR